MQMMEMKGITREPVVLHNGESHLFGMLHRPVTDKKVPAVVIVHGFASHKVGTNRSWVLLAEALREAGIATLRFDQRGFGDSEGDSSELGISDLVDDVEVALSYMKQLEGIDPTRIALFGSSLGGTLSVLAAARAQWVAAIALWAPVATGALSIADLFMANPKLAMAADPAAFLSTYRGVRLSSRFQQQFKELSAIDALRSLQDVPLLHMHGADDQMVTIQHQKAFQEARKGASAESTFITHPHTQHFLGNEVIFKEALKTYVEWFAQQLR